MEPEVGSEVVGIVSADVLDVVSLVVWAFVGVTSEGEVSFARMHRNVNFTHHYG